MPDHELTAQMAQRYRDAQADAALRAAEEAAMLEQKSRAAQDRIWEQRRAMFARAAAEAKQGDGGSREDAIERSIAERLGIFGVAERYQDVDLERLPAWLPEQYRRTAAKLLSLRDRPGTIALCGDRGRGKTALGCGLVRAFIASDRFARYLTADAFFDALRSAPDIERRMRDLARLHLLVIDEVQDRTAPPWLEPKLSAIVDARYAAKRTTVLMGCLAPAEFKVDVGDSIHRRIVEEHGYVECLWARIESVRPRLSIAAG